jgi:ATP-dependent RNA helicase DHX37/DHR1
MIKTWAKLQPRTQSLLQELTSRNVDSLDTLLAAWQKDKLYLLVAYQAWVPESLHGEVEALWPPV